MPEAHVRADVQQPGPACEVDGPDVQVYRVWKREPASEFGRAEAPVELEQGERIAVCLLDDPGPDALVERA